MRGTQSLVQILARCWTHPGWIARELAWRWLFGIPALGLLFVCARRLLAILFAAHTGIEDFSLQDTVAATRILRDSYAAIAPSLRHFALWVAPLLAIGWAIASGVGRNFVLRALATEARFRPVPLILLQLLRIVALAATVSVWFALVLWAARGTVTQLPPGVEPSTVAFSAWLICLSLGSFTVWAIWSWVLSIASVLVVMEGRGVLRSLRASLRLGSLTAKLAEVNLVLGIVKLALIVLAMVFSSIPLPFETVMAGTALYIWWIAVAIWFLAASDFFQVARLAAFLNLWRTARERQQLHL